MAKKKTPAKKRTRQVAKTKQVQAHIPDSLTFDYMKSNLFRVIRVDGAHGGITPKGAIQMALFSERQAIPKQETYNVESTGKLGGITRKEARDAVIREVEIEALMELDVAKALRSWLDDRITFIEGLKK